MISGSSNAIAKVAIAPAAHRSSWAQALLAALSASHLRATAALVLLSLVCFLPGFVSLQPMDRDEPRFAQATKQMLETGDLVAIRFQDEARNKKPVGIYWLQAASVTVAEALGLPEARTTIAVYRLPSLIGAVAAVLLTYWALLAAVGRREALLAAAFMGATVLLGVEARFAKTDAVLTASCVAMMGGLLRAHLRRTPLSRGALALFWGGLALSILVKGPVGPMIVALPALALTLRERSGRWLLALKPLLGFAVVLLLVLPWFIAIAVETRGAFFAEAIGKDMLGKVGSGQERHWAPPGTYLLVFFGTAWPLAPFVAIASQTWWRERRDDVVAFALAWVLPAWLVFELVPTKLPHYVLPLFPALALLAVRGIATGDVSPRRWGALAGAALLVLIPLAALVALPIAGVHLGGAIPYAALPVLALSTALAAAAWLAFRADGPWRAALLSIAAAAIFAVGLFGTAQRLLTALKLSPRLAAAVHGVPCPAPQTVTAGYREPSLVFLVGTDLAMADGAGAADFLAHEGCRVALVTDREEPAFTARLRALGLSPALVTRVVGFNINGGKRLDVGVYRRP
ncbi:ArnT family glycosyltransferase [Chelatococcus reniformis]|uniref:Glycosyl transferase n=1 Tax=Chelatococcus reniformis TaxID=1494448 RepID=A0A916UFH1_9HYPH|nr:glycosyltransferase family 39 protein [Chelatococcus reniformis]GGC71197.1 glycosyl transferase [Chelatococcus reniformis]